MDKIPEVLAVARTVVRQYGHTKKYAKHIVALVIKQDRNLTDVALAEFLSKDTLGRILGYERRFDHTIFSKVRRSAAAMMSDIYQFILSKKMTGKQVRLVAQDGTDIPAYSNDDKDARVGHRTPSKREQIVLDDKKDSFFFGYKLHLIVDAESEMPIAFCVAPGNRHDSVFFQRLYDRIKERFKFHLNFDPKYLADAAFDSTKIYKQLHHDNVKPLIAVNGRGFYRSKSPKEPDYGKRWSVERVFSRLKEVFGLSTNRVIGIGKVLTHVYSCLIGYILRYG